METFPPGGSSWTLTDWSGACNDIQEALFRHQASDEIIDTFAQEEEVALSQKCLCQVNPEVRSQAVRLVTSAIPRKESAHEDATWFWVMQAFDTGSAMLGDATEGRVLARAAAACLTGLRLADRTPPNVRLAEQLAGIASQVSAEKGQGESVSAEAVVGEQQRLITKLRSRLRAPTVAAWVRAILVRFDAATSGLHSGHLGEVQRQACKMSHKFLRCTPVSADCPPHALAAGSCAVALCAAGLVQQQSLVHFGADQVASETIAAAVAAVRMSLGAGTVQEPDAKFQEACELLKFAAACNAEKLQLALGLGVAAVMADHQQMK